MIKAKVVKVGFDTLIKGFTAEYTVSDMLLINKALRMLLRDNDTHQSDKATAKRLLAEVHESLREDGESNV